MAVPQRPPPPSVPLIDANGSMSSDWWRWFYRIPLNAADLTLAAIASSGSASDLVAGTVPAARMSGSYPGITGLGILTVGTWQADVIGATYGGTGINNAARTLTLSGSSWTLAGLTAPRTITFPDASETVATLGQAQTITGNKSFNSGTLILKGSTSGTLTVKPAAVAGTNTLTLPAGTTDFSATGGASQVVKQTSAGGALTVAQLAASDLSDTIAATSWTPTDQSGAGLAFTNVSARYSQIGNLVYAYGTLTYPATASGAAAKISLPVAAINQPYAQMPGAMRTTAGVANAPNILPIQGTSTALIQNASNSASYTNANLSTALISFMAIYPVS